MFDIQRGDAAAALSVSDPLVELTREHSMTLYHAHGSVHAAWARARLSGGNSQVTKLAQAVSAFTEHGAKLYLPFYEGLLAELGCEKQSADLALTRINGALTLSEQTGQHWIYPFLHRVRGGILLKRDRRPRAGGRCVPGRPRHCQAPTVAQLRPAGGAFVPKLYQSTSRPADAHAVLAPALEGFSPTPEQPEIAEAQALLAALAETDEVKADAARRHQLTQLHVSYGNALIAARGYGAPETAEAFTRARESASGYKDAPGAIGGPLGLWVGSLTRGDLPSMRAHAADFLNDIAARPNSPEAGVAHRAAGTTCWFAGEYREARDHLERALALFQPGRDDDLAFRSESTLASSR